MCFFVHLRVSINWFIFSLIVNFLLCCVSVGLGIITYFSKKKKENLDIILIYIF